MEPLHAPTAMTHFLRLIHACPNTQAVTTLVRSIYSWLSYYGFFGESEKFRALAAAS